MAERVAMLNVLTGRVETSPSAHLELKRVVLKRAVLVPWLAEVADFF